MALNLKTNESRPIANSFKLELEVIIKVWMSLNNWLIEFKVCMMDYLQGLSLKESLYDFKY